MAKAIITNVTINSKINTAYVAYSTGTEKTYPADKLPKTVQAWIEENEQENAQIEQENAQIEQEVAQTEQEVAQELDHETVQAVEELELPVPVFEPVVEAVEAAVEPEPAQEPRHNVSGRPRQLQCKETKSLPLDIVDAVVGALLIASRLSLIALAYLFASMAAAVRAGISAYEWLAPRSAALIERAVSTYHDIIRPACHDATVWMAEAVWYVVICFI